MECVFSFLNDLPSTPRATPLAEHVASLHLNLTSRTPASPGPTARATTPNTVMATSLAAAFAPGAAALTASTRARRRSTTTSQRGNGKLATTRAMHGHGEPAAGGGLHSSTFRLNLSASCQSGGAFKGCLEVV